MSSSRKLTPRMYGRPERELLAPTLPAPTREGVVADAVGRRTPAGLIVLLLGLLAHGLVLLTDHVIWDGWWATADLGLPDAGILARQFRESGKPLVGWFLAPFRLIAAPEGRIAAGKLAGVACWIGSFLAMHACLRRLARLEAPVALTISALAVAAPVYEVLGDVSLAMYPACMLLFWCG